LRERKRETGGEREIDRYTESFQYKPSRQRRND